MMNGQRELVQELYQKTTENYKKFTKISDFCFIFDTFELSTCQVHCLSTVHHLHLPPSLNSLSPHDLFYFAQLSCAIPRKFQKAIYKALIQNSLNIYLTTDMYCTD